MATDQRKNWKLFELLDVLKFNQVVICVDVIVYYRGYRGDLNETYLWALPKNTSKIKMSDSESTENAIKSPYKSPVKMFGWLFGNPMENFDMTTSASTSTSTDKSFCPTKQNVIQHWMACVDKNRKSYQSDKNAIIGEVVDNLISFWSKNTSIELR